MLVKRINQRIKGGVEVVIEFLSTRVMQGLQITGGAHTTVASTYWTRGKR
jgi:hypothetical protein